MLEVIDAHRHLQYFFTNPGTARDRAEQAVDVHRVDLVACPTVAFRLKDQLFPVEGKIRFGILAAKGELPLALAHEQQRAGALA